MVQSGLARASNVHRRAFSDSLKSFKHSYLVCRIIFLFFSHISHKIKVSLKTFLPKNTFYRRQTLVSLNLCLLAGFISCDMKCLCPSDFSFISLQLQHILPALAGAKIINYSVISNQMQPLV